MGKTARLFLHPYKDGDSCIHYEFCIPGKNDGNRDFICRIASECASGHVVMQHVNYYESHRKRWFFNRKSGICTTERIKEDVENGKVKAVACEYRNVCGAQEEIKHLCILQKQFEALDTNVLHVEIFADKEIVRTTSDVLDFYRSRLDYMTKIQSDFSGQVGYTDVNTQYMSREKFEKIFEKVCEGFGLNFEYKQLEHNEVCRID